MSRVGWRFRLFSLLLAVVVLMTGAVQAAGAAQAGAHYVALGDSYAAGPYVPPSGMGPPGCLQSSANYAHLLAAQLQIHDFRDVSCSGASTREMLGPQATTGGINAPQLDALGKSTRIVTLQIGGNDIGFSEIVTNCLSVLPLFHPCRDRYSPVGVDEIRDRIELTGPQVDAVLAEIEVRAPIARTFVVGYPSILPEQGAGCWPTMLFTPSDAPYLVDKLNELNEMLRERTERHGAVFVDTYTASLGHDACTAPGVRWIEPFVPLVPALPVHPNAGGMLGMAAAVKVAIEESGGPFGPEAPPPG